MTPRAPSSHRRFGLVALAAFGVSLAPALAQQSAPSPVAPAAPAPAPAPVAVPAAAPAPQKPALDRHGMPEKMSGEQIKEIWFDGRPFVATGPDGTAFRMVFTPDGKASRLAMAGKKPKPVVGFWRVIAEGYCSRWSGSNREKCFNVRKSEDGTRTIVRFGQQIAGTWERP
ncbi:hypothetical protein [Pinisolibacter sp.]|uniref:hypothetical protein n=1 Tax=Pinisolibacter sp. TaxID=2172024 RepID=UPI002FDEB8EF